VRTLHLDAGRQLPWCLAKLRESWGSEHIVRKGQSVDASSLPTLVHIDDHGNPTAMAAYLLEGERCELVVLEADPPGHGHGSHLLQELTEVCRGAGARSLWLITTNDNIDALRFYLCRGFRLTAVHLGAVDQARAQKPSIPLVGNHGIELHDELELERPL
jgi:GNAT superfamily N-acetyltransferase